MTIPAERFRRCPSCARPAPVGRFDLTVASNGDERHFFGLAAAVCRACRRLVLDADATRLFRIDPADVLAAIQSDSCLTEAPGADAA